MYFLQEIIKYDLFSKKVNLRIGVSDVTSTFYSKFLTKVLLILVLIYFVELMIDIFKRNNLNSNLTTRKAYPRPNLTISSDNFKFAFALFDRDDNIIIQSELDRYYVPKFYLYSSLNKGGQPINVKRTYYNIRNCVSDDFTDIDPNYINLNNLTAYSCPENYNFQISGYDDENSMNLLVFRLDYCNDLAYNNCKPLDEVLTKIQGAYVKMYILDHDVDLGNYESPFVSYLKYISSEHFDLNYALDDRRYLKTIEIYTDDSFYTKHYKTDINFQFSEELNLNYLSNTDNYLKDNSTSRFYDLNLISYQKVETISREYNKLWDGMSSLGGIMKFIISFGYLLTKKFHKIEESINLIKSRNIITFNNENDDIERNETNPNRNPYKKKLSFTSFEIAGPSSNRVDNDNSSLNPLNHENLENSDTTRKKTINNKVIENYEIEIESQIKLPQNLDIFMNFKKRKKPSFNKDNLSYEETFQPQVLNNQNLSNQPSHENKVEINKINNNVKENNIHWQWLQENFEKNYENLQKNKNNFNFTFFEKLSIIFGFIPNKNKEKQKKYKVFFTGKKELDNFLDVDYIIHKLKEIESIKELIFNRNQLEIFNFINKFHENRYLNEQKTFGYWERPTQIPNILNYFKQENVIKDSLTRKIDNKLGKILGKLIHKTKTQ